MEKPIFLGVGENELWAIDRNENGEWLKDKRVIEVNSDLLSHLLTIFRDSNEGLQIRNTKWSYRVKVV